MTQQRRQIVKVLLSTAAFVTIAGLGTSPALAQTNLLQRARETRSIRVGVANIAPHVILEGENATGEAVEVSRKALAKLGISDLKFVTVDFGSLIPALQARRIDMIAAGMSITPPRCAQAAFSDPYYGKAEALLVPKGNPLKLKNYEDIAANPKARFGHVLGGTEAAQAAAAGIKEAQISTFPDSATLADALKAGRIDALALPDLQINWTLSKPGWDAFESPGPFVPKVQGKDQVLYTAFGFHPENAEFRDAFNQVLKDMKRDGTVAATVKDFAITDFGVNLAKDRTWQEVCSGQF